MPGKWRLPGWCARWLPDTVSARRTALFIGLVVTGLLLFDLAFLAYGTYRIPEYDGLYYYLRSGQIIAWLGDLLPPIRQLFSHSGFSPEYAGYFTFDKLTLNMAKQGIGYPMFLAGLQLIVGEGQDRVRIGQALLHVLSALLVYRVAVDLFSRKVGLIALVLFALYVPFTYMVSQLRAENLCVFLILAAILLAHRTLSAAPGWRPVLGFLFGLTLIWLALTRPVFSPMVAVMLLLWLAVAIHRWRTERSASLTGAMAMVLVAFLVPYLVWQSAVTRVHHLDHFTFSTAGPRVVTGSLAESYDVRTNGWPRPAAFVGKGGRSVQPIPAWNSIREHPFDSLMLRVEKFYRLWRRPVTVYTNPMVIPRGVTDVLHVAVITLGLAGLLLVRRNVAWLFLLLPVFYSSAVYTFYFSEERRFIYPVMALVIIVAAKLLQEVAPQVRDLWRRTRFRPDRGMVAVLATLALSGLYVYAGAGAVPVPGVSGRLFHLLAALLFSGALAALGWRATGWLQKPAESGRPLRLALVLTLVLPIAVHLAWFHDWYSWKVTLKHPGQVAEQVIRLPSGLDPKRVAVARLHLDVLDRDGKLDNLTVAINGEPLDRFIPGRQLSKSYQYVVEKLAPLQLDIDWQAVDLAPDTPMWLTYPLDFSVFSPRESLIITVGLNRVPAHSGEFVDLAGALPTGAEGTIKGPVPWLDRKLLKKMRPVPFAGRGSYWRYQTYGDMRIHRTMQLSGDSESRYVTGVGTDHEQAAQGDLSDDLLFQTGGYRIRLQLITRDGTELFL